MSSEAQGEGEGNEVSLDLPDPKERDGFWRLLLGRKYDNMNPAEKTEETLLSEFYTRRTEVIDDIYDSKQGLIEEIQDGDNDPEVVLETAWAENKWQNKSLGDEFEFDNADDIDDELERLDGNGYIIDTLNNDLVVIWTEKRVSRPRAEGTDVRSRLDEDWAPLFAKRRGDTRLEVRGRRRRRHQLSSNFAEEGKAKKVLKEEVSESVLDGLSEIFTKELNSLDVIEVRFRHTKLPDSSALTLRNESGVQDDLDDDKINPKVISPESLSHLKHIKFKDNKTDNIAKVEMVQHAISFSFDLKSRYIDDKETEKVKEVITEEFGISFDKKYPYHKQHQNNFILQQILTGNGDAYEQYYEELSEDDQELVDEYISAAESTKYVCFSCRNEFEEHQEECPNCENDTFDEELTRKVEIDGKAIHSDVVEIFEEFDEDISSSEGGIKLLNLSTDNVEIASSNYIRATFQRAQVAEIGMETAMEHYRYEYYVYCLGNRTPQRVGQYLLNTVLVTYGTAYDREIDNFGTIGLIEFLRSDEPEKLFLEAVEKSHRRRRDEYRDRAKDAVDRLRILQSKVESGAVEEYVSSDDEEQSDDDDNEDEDDTDEFLDSYSAKKFERDVFYLLKSIFTFTERWGREGKKETDGLLVIPKDEDEYYVAGFDPKFTTDPKGYNIRSTEKDKAAYYLLSESDKEYINSVLKREDDIVDGHIFISDIFREGQFDSIAEQVENWFSLVKEGEKKWDDIVVFLRVSELLEIYDIFDTNYTFLREYPSIMDAFRQEVVEQLTSGRDYVEIDDQACGEIKKQVINELDQRRKSRDTQDYKD